MANTSTPLDEQDLATLINTLQQLGFDGAKIEELGTDKKKLAKIIEHAMDTTNPHAASDEEKVILVIGECGDGKSTLVNALRDMNFGDGLAKVGRAAGGVTKDIIEYVGKDINGQKIRILDTPGIGDQKVKPPELVSKIQQVLGDVTIDGVIVTTKITDGRCKMGAQVVQKLVEEAMISEPGTNHNKWHNIILAGTQRDVAMSPEFIEEGEPTPIENFVASNDIIDEYGDPVGTVANFFRAAPNGWGSYALVEKNDYSELEAAIAKLPSVPVRYRMLSPEEMSKLLSTVMGVDVAELQADFEKWKHELEAEQEAKMAKLKAEMEAEHAKQLAEADAAQKAVLEKMDADRKAEAEEVAAKMTAMEVKRKKAEKAAADEVKKIRADSDANLEKLRKQQEKMAKEAEAKTKEEVKAIEIKFEAEKKRFEEEFDRRRREAERSRNDAQMELQRLHNLSNELQYGRQLESMRQMIQCPSGGGRRTGPQGQPIQEGPRGGRYYINRNGNKTYVRD